VQRKCAPVLNSPAARNHTGGIKADTYLTEGEPELHAPQRVVHANSCRCVRVRGKVESSGGCDLQCSLELDKRAQCLESADHAEEVRQVTLERAGEEQQLGLSSQGRSCNFRMSAMAWSAQSSMCAVM
jgi:hypothetical protein